MRTFEEIEADAEQRTPFSNGSEWDAWSGHWCGQCPLEETCPILDVVFIREFTPKEWQPDVRGSLHRPYRCTEYQGPEVAHV